MQRCAACGRILGQKFEADPRDGNGPVFVGPDCHKRIVKAGHAGFAPPNGGPRLYPMPKAEEAA